MSSVKESALQYLFSEYSKLSKIPFQRWNFEKLSTIELQERRKRKWRENGEGSLTSKYRKGSNGRIRNSWNYGAWKQDEESEDESTDDKIVKVSGIYRRTRRCIPKWRGVPDAKIVVVKDCVSEEDMNTGTVFSGEEGDLIARTLEEMGYGNSVLMTAVVCYPLPRDVPIRVNSLRKHVGYFKALLNVVQPQVVVCVDKLCSTLVGAGISLNRMLHVHKSVVTDSTLVPRLQPVVKSSHSTAYLHRIGHAFHFVSVPPRGFFRSKKSAQEWSEELRRCIVALPELPDRIPEILVYDVAAMAEKTARQMLEKGCTEEEIQRMYSTAESTGFDMPSGTFYSHPGSAKSRVVDPLPTDKILFCVTSITYSEDKNLFYAFGPVESPEGVSVCVEIVGACFTFWSSIPEGWSSTSASEESCIRELASNLGESLKRKLCGMRGVLKKEAPEWIAEFQDTSVDIKIIEGKMDSSKVYLPTMPKDRFIQYTVGCHAMVKFVVNHLREAYPEPGFKVYHGNHTAVQYLAFFNHIWCGCWTEVKLDDVKLMCATKHSSSMKSTCDLELSVHASSVRSHSEFDESAKYSAEDKKRWSKSASRRVLVVDMEMKGIGRAFPRPTSSPIISICCEIHHYGESTAFNSSGFSNAYDVYCFALGMSLPPPWDTGGNRAKKKWAREFDYRFETELEMIAAWAKFVVEADPDEVVGHNHKSFDLWYVTERYRHLTCAMPKEDRVSKLYSLGMGKELRLGRLKGVCTHVTKKRFYSKASGERMIYTVHCAGRNVIDTLDLFMKMKERKYTLNYLASVYLKDMKNDVDYMSIPILYNGGFYTLYELNEYCKQDVSLTARLYNIRKCSIGLAETCRLLRCVTPEQLAVSGQQEKVFGSVMTVNMDNGQPLFIESKPFKRDEEEEDGGDESSDGENDGEDCTSVVETLPEDDLCDAPTDGDNAVEGEDDNRHKRRKLAAKPTRQLSLYAFVNGDADDEEEEGAQKKPVFAKEQRKRTRKAAKKKEPRYKGGFVRPLKPGLTDENTYLISLDFSSMYPNNHRAFNIDPGRLMYDSDFDREPYKSLITRAQCYRIDDCMGFNDATGKEEPIYFVPETFKIGSVAIGKGLIPITIDMLLRLRKQIKDKQKLYPPGSMQWSVCEEQQLAVKLVANSIYGSFGAKSGTLAKKEVAMAITAEGRKHILIVEDMLRKQVEKVYEKYPVGTPLPWPENAHEKTLREMRTVGGDTDSVFPAFPFVSSVEEAVEFGVVAEHMVNKILPKPMGVEFEKVIYRFFSVATKRYAGFFVIDASLDFFYAKKRWIEHNEPKESWPELFSKHRWTLNTKVPDDTFEGFHVITEKFGTDQELATRIGEDRASKIFKARGTRDFARTCAITKLETVVLEDWFYADVIAPKKTWFERIDAQKKKSLAVLESCGLEEWVRTILKVPRYDIPMDNPRTRGKTSYRGIETVRRDACLYTKDIMEKFLEMVIVEGRVEDAVAHYKECAMKLVCGGVDPSQLLCANQYSKPYRAYKNPNLPHLGVVKRLIDSGEEPELGTRVQYLVFEPDPQSKKNVKDIKLYEHCCSPDEFINKRLRIDYKHYFNRFLAGPFKPLLTVVGADVDTLTNADKLLASVKNNKYRMASAVLMSTCTGCKTRFVRSKQDEVLCLGCTLKIMGSKGNCKEAETAMSSLIGDMEDMCKEMKSRLDECGRCTSKSYTHPDQIMCKNYECKFYFGMRTVAHRMENAKTKLDGVKKACACEGV